MPGFGKLLCVLFFLDETTVPNSVYDIFVDKLKALKQTGLVNDLVRQFNII